MSAGARTTPIARLTRGATVCLAAGLSVLAGCGGAGSTRYGGGSAGAGATTTHAAAASTAPSTTASAATVPVVHLSIVSPRAGSRTGTTVTVHVAVSHGALAGGTLHYLLDRRLTRTGGTRLTFHELAPGSHRLEVISAGGAAHAATAFTVRTPPAPPAPVPAPAAPTSSAPSPQPSETSPSPPAGQSAPSGGGIPQNGGGDGDGDNHGGPSDGDGNV